MGKITLVGDLLPGAGAELFHTLFDVNGGGGIILIRFGGLDRKTAQIHHGRDANASHGDCDQHFYQSESLSKFPGDLF